jgi:cyanate permease
MLFGGYVIASLAPVALGLLRDATGGFDVGLWLLVAIAVFLAGACWWFIPPSLGSRADRASIAAAG